MVGRFTKAKMKRRLQQIDESIERYLGQMASADRQKSSEDKSQRLEDKITGGTWVVHFLLAKAGKCWVQINTQDRNSYATRDVKGLYFLSLAELYRK